MRHLYRILRVILATPLYLTATFVLLLSLKIYPPDIREVVKDNARDLFA